MCKHCRQDEASEQEEPKRKPTALRDVRVVRQFPNAPGHKTPLKVPEAGSLWLDKEESPSIYLCLNEGAWFQWAGADNWRLLESIPKLVSAPVETGQEFVKGFYYDHDTSTMYARDGDGNWKTFDAAKTKEWVEISSTDRIMELLKNLMLIPAL